MQNDRCISKYLIAFALLNIFLLNIFSCNSDKKYFKSINDIETYISQKNTNIISVNVLYDEGDWLEKKLKILITFGNNQWILLRNVTSEEDQIIIEGVNGYEIRGFAKKLTESDCNSYYDIDQYANVLEKTLGIKFVNIDIIIQNFDKIVLYVDNLVDISSEEYYNRSIDWFWNNETEFRKVKIQGYERIEFKKPLWEYATVDHIGGERKGVDFTW